MTTLTRVSLELTQACEKACWFCYNHSHAGGVSRWAPQEVIDFARDCAQHGVQVMSLGGGEPLQYEGLEEVIAGVRRWMDCTMTTNGLRLDEAALDRLVGAGVQKIHVSLHFPERGAELRRVARQVRAVAARGVLAGVNLLVRRSQLEQAQAAAEALRQAGIDNRRIVYLPMRGQDTPSPRELAQVAGNTAFQSMTCLGGCARSPRFCSVGWDRRVGWCSYTSARRAMEAPTFQGMMDALRGLPLVFCGPEGAEGSGGP